MLSCFYQRCPLKCLKIEYILIQLKYTPHFFKNVQGLIKELFQLIEPCHVIGTGEYLKYLKGFIISFEKKEFFKIVGQTPVVYYTCSCENLNSNCIESPSKAVILLKSLATSPISFSPLRKAETKASNSGIIWACKKEEPFKMFGSLILMSIHQRRLRDETCFNVNSAFHGTSIM